MLIVFSQVFSQDILVEESQSIDYKSYEFLITENQNKSSDISGEFKKENHQMDFIIESDASDENEGTADITFLAPIADSKFKRGNAIQVRWTGGNPDDEYALDLFDGRFHYRHVGELKNSGTYPWIIPKDIKPGKEYKFKLTNTNDFGEYAFSRTFVVKRRVPVLVWIIPGALVVGGATYLLLSGEEEEPDLPAPIEPN
jgi:hypothetical protein